MKFFVISILVFHTTAFTYLSLPAIGKTSWEKHSNTKPSIFKENKQILLSLPSSSDDNNDNGIKNKVSFQYCTGCRWMLRSSWMAQELLTTFQEELDEVSLIPSRPPAPGGQFIVTLNDEEIWNREEMGRFPETKELKRMIRNIIAPEKGLGHSDDREQTPQVRIDDDDDDEHLDTRMQFGVA